MLFGYSLHLCQQTKPGCYHSGERSGVLWDVCGS